MTAKTQRITILGSLEFKAFLTEEARREGISVSELVRRRCEQRPPDKDDEQVFAELVAQLQSSVEIAKRNLGKGMRNAETILAELRERRRQAGSDTAATG